MNLETCYREFQNLLTLRRLRLALEPSVTTLTLDELSSGAVIDFREERDRRWIEQHMVKRCAILAITPGTYQLAVRLALNARHSGADPEQALQAGVNYATRHQVRGPRDDGPLEAA